MGKPLEVVGSWANISDRKQAERALGERLAIMKDLQALIAASPSVIYTTQVSGDFACTFVSDNLKSTMGYATWEMRDDPKFWVKHIHPDDAQRVFAELDQRIGLGGGTVEYRFRHRSGHFIWIQDTFTVTHDNGGKPKELIGSWADISDRKRARIRVGASCQGSGAAQPLHPRDVRALFDGRRGCNRARISLRGCRSAARSAKSR